jgi:hypothetical protein
MQRGGRSLDPCTRAPRAGPRCSARTRSARPRVRAPHTSGSCAASPPRSSASARPPHRGEREGSRAARAPRDARSFAAGRAESNPHARGGSAVRGEEARRAGKQAPIRSSRRRTSEKTRVSWRGGGGWRPVIAIPAREQRLSIEPARVEVEPWCSHPRARDHDGLKDKASSRSKGGSRSPLRAKSPRISSARRARQRPSRAVLRREPLAAQVRSGYHLFPDQEPHPAHLGHQHQQELARRRPRAWARDQGARTAPHVANVAIVRGLPPTWTR